MKQLPLVYAIVAPSTFSGPGSMIHTQYTKEFASTRVLCVCGSKIAVTLGVVSPCDYPRGPRKGKKGANMLGAK